MAAKRTSRKRKATRAKNRKSSARKKSHRKESKRDIVVTPTEQQIQTSIQQGTTQTLSDFRRLASY
jgi:hypothetical protein